ncbi:MAG: DNA internalization-related competence protein ComEC/Rec2 [Lachnospiraceae bacterium]|nr:DNA internalization-related competence protein ComEC/Rec2 [Lachnospiraceae bacterium]
MKRPLFWVCVLLSVIVVLHFFGSGASHREGIRDASPPSGNRLAFSGKVCSKELREDCVIILLTDLSAYQNAAASRQIISMFHKTYTDRLQCTFDLEADFVMPKIGSTLVVEGEFSAFREATNPGEFNLAEYYQGKQVGGALSDVVILSESEKYSVIGEALSNLRAYFSKRLAKVFPTRDAGTLQAMLLGERTELDEEVRSLYLDGGIMHVLCISGLHVSMLGLGLYELLRRLGVKAQVAAVAAGVVLVLYGIMTGMSVSACRAIGMFLLRMFASVIGRTVDLLTSLSVMALVLLMDAPSLCLNSGFWLSFGSMMGVGVILPLWESIRRDDMAAPLLVRTRSRAVRTLFLWGEKIGQGVRASLSILLVTTPLLLWFYFEVPVYSTLLNLLVIPAMGPVLLFGFLAMLIPGLGILGTVDVAAFALFEKLCLVVTRLPFHTWNPGCPKLWQIAAYYILLTVILGLLWHIRKKRRGLLRYGMLLCILPLLLFLLPVRHMTGVVFLDVGQGDSVLLRLSDGQTYLYDCGSVTKGKVGEKILLPYLKHEGIHRLDAVFLSHDDTDHVSGVKELLLLAAQEEIAIDGLYVSGQGDFSGVQEALRVSGLYVLEWDVFAQGQGSLAQLQENSTQVKGGSVKDSQVSRRVPGLHMTRLSQGDMLEGKNITFTVLHPSTIKNAPMDENEASGLAHGLNTTKSAPLDENEASLCLWVQLRNGKDTMTILLTGDVQGAGEKGLLNALQAQNLRNVDILKCAHHGSKNATSEAFLSWLDARCVVISCAKKNSYGHPHAELLQRLATENCDIFRTDQQGCLTLRLAGKEIKVTPFYE